MPTLSLGVVILISRLTGAQSRHNLYYSNMKYKFGMVKTSETQLKCATDEKAQATINGKSGGETMKNKNPLKPLTETSEESQTNSETGTHAADMVLEQAVALWHTGWEGCSDKDILEFACLLVTFAFS